jgi:hypothetical protein
MLLGILGELGQSHTSVPTTAATPVDHADAIGNIGGSSGDAPEPGVTFFLSSHTSYASATTSVAAVVARPKCGFVPQHPWLLNASVRANILFDSEGPFDQGGCCATLASRRRRLPAA